MYFLFILALFLKIIYYLKLFILNRIQVNSKQVLHNQIKLIYSDLNFKQFEDLVKQVIINLFYLFFI